MPDSKLKLNTNKGLPKNVAMETTDTRAIPGQYKRLIEDYCFALEEHFGEKLSSICLFGSVARGKAKPESDIDILVLVDELPPDLGLRTRETNYIHENLKKTEGYLSLRKLGRSGLISDFFFTPQEIKNHPPILLDVIDDGIIIYDKASFLSKELKVLKERLNRLKARKVITAKGHYWILKPDIKPGEIVDI